MSPFESARLLCHLRGGNWQAEHEAFLANGYVISTPTVFAMGRMCGKSDYLPDPWEPWPEGDDFFAWTICGPLKEVATYLPEKAQWVGFFRQGRGHLRNRWIESARFRLALLTRTR